MCCLVILVLVGLIKFRFGRLLCWMVSLLLLIFGWWVVVLGMCLLSVICVWGGCIRFGFILCILGC